jgi:sigma-B regulation protein RsbU (phosphoserine phosphatase)
MHLRALLRDQRETIMDNFVERVRLGPLEAGKLPETLIRDGLPTFLDRLAADLERWTVPELPPGRRDPATCAAEHGEQRQALGVDVVQVAREWAVLHDVILEMAMAEGLTLVLAEYQLFSRHINGAAIEAIRQHCEATARELDVQS